MRARRGKRSRPSSRSLSRLDAPSFEQVLDAVQDLIFVKAKGSRLLWANKAFREYYGMTNEELQGLIDAPFVPPDQTQQYVKDDAWVVKHGKALEIPVEPITRHDGVIRSVHTMKYPLFNRHNEVVMTVVVCRDITEKLDTERAIEMERARTLSAVKLASLGEMAGGIAHEMNTPLATIHTLAGQLGEMLQEEPMDISVCLEHLEKIEKTALRMAQIISGLRTLMHGGEQLERVSTRLSQLVEETLAFCRERLALRGISVQVKHECVKVKALCHPSQLSQVLLNLLVNAVDAVETSTTPWIRIETKKLRGQIEISVTDSGPGVAPALRTRIFDPFFTTKAVGKGTGLGLSVSRSMVDANGGTLELDVTAANTRFVVTIPSDPAGTTPGNH